MNIKQLVLGEYATNSYILQTNSNGNECLIIDTGLEAGPLLDYLVENNLKPIAVVFTHGHADHIKGLLELQRVYPEIKVCIHKSDAPLLTKADLNLSILTGTAFVTKQADVILSNGDKIEHAGIKLKMIHTPGHTQGSICLYSRENNLIFSGDTLFANSLGATDFPGGNMTQLVSAIKQKLLILEDNTIVYPGHGPQTTIGHEKKHNQFLR